MRDRLVAALVGMTITMIALYGVPRAYQLADLVTTQENAKITRSANLLTVVITERNSAAAPVTSDFLAGLLNTGESIEYVAADASVVRAGAPATGEDDIVQRRSLPGGGTVTITRSGDVVDERVSKALLPLILIGLGLVAVAACIGYVLARRLARPFGELAEAADHLGRGRFDVELPHYAIPEAERIGAALRRASAKLDGLVEREREFAANVSHQLRTPVTSLRLTLEDLSMWPETPASVASELTSSMSELDRLNAAITEILELSRGQRLGDAVDVDLSELVGDTVDRWKQQYADSGRVLVHDPTEPVLAHVVPGPVVQVIDVLLENARAHGTGRVVAGARERGRYLHVIVADEGLRTVGDEVFQRGTGDRDSDGHGLGLTIASQLATSLDGYLVLAEAATTTFVLILPAPGVHDVILGTVPHVTVDVARDGTADVTPDVAARQSGP
ncbi:putative two-component system histidine kinase [Janibacter sp. HTCC2649]|uniref:HAMP domain-containing sensor histidine kinase n=1 Tax=Janibacter sp. HTCC2649 TaxID=313589 RepID=UPI000067180B|nr:HAMP domain-containing sensor histidine kinase [Janibacter sp. HTCC2649]EAP98172.1 putative two-component system histidine kinase [Janibacter sp. HTCC2649]